MGNQYTVLRPDHPLRNATGARTWAATETLDQIRDALAAVERRLATVERYEQWRHLPGNEEEAVAAIGELPAMVDQLERVFRQKLPVLRRRVAKMSDGDRR